VPVRRILLPASDLPPGAVLIRLALAFVLATVLWVGVSNNQNPLQKVAYAAAPIIAHNSPSYYPLKGPPPVTVTLEGLSSDLNKDTARPTLYIDLSHVSPAAHGLVTVPVQVRDRPARVDVTIAPKSVSVQLDRASTRTIPVQVLASGPPAPGFEPPQFTPIPSTVKITGPSRVVDNVVIAHVLPALNAGAFTQQASLEEAPQLFDRTGVSVPRGVVQITPSHIAVSVTARRQPYQQLLPVLPAIRGAVAPGYAISSIAVVPQLVQVVSSSQLATTTLTTEPITVTGWVSTHTVPVTITVPGGVPGGVQLNRTQATVTINVSPVPASATAIVGVLVRGQRPGTTVALDTASVAVSYQGPLSQLKATPRVVLALGGRGPGTYHLRPSVILAPQLSLSAIAPSTMTITILAQHPPTAPPTSKHR